MSQAPKNGSTGEPTRDGADAVPPARKGTGPRTQQGKERSKRNAVTHGIFCKIVLSNDESEEEFNSLWKGLLNHLRPEGALEEILVEKLASHVWRYRRLLIAEAAEVQRGTEDDTWGKFEREKQEAAIFLKSEEKSRAGLLLKIENTVIWGKCLQKLEQLRNAIVFRGFDPSADMQLLTVLFGDAEMADGTAPLLLSYRVFGDSGTRPPPDLDDPEERKLAEKLATLEGRKAKFLGDLQVKIDELEGYPAMVARFTGQRERLKLLFGNVPDAPALDRLLRYEASLERSFDRTLSQLERLQRMRSGQPVSSKLEVHHSLS
jgi:hypothetical protein